ncbi:MAG: ABC transporter ATP-binding protein, partial [Kiritimatiellaeota bacterium]|nr:ABC transporter ATP-binding protein [Kiritimatiellota bacterium]
PVSALDVSVQTQVIDLLARLQKEHALSMLFISHDIAVVGLLARRIAVMKDGALVELGETERVLRHPQHPYTQRLLAAIL